MYSKFFGRMLFIVPILILGFVIPLAAQPGDCNGDASVNASDAIPISNYIAFGTPVPGDSAECDCDGHAGITIGDALQILYFVFQGGAVYPSPSTDVPIPSGVRFYYNGKVDYGLTTPKDFVDIEVEVPPGFDIYGLQLPFCFETEPGEQDVEVDNVDFSGSLIAGTAFIDNASKSFHIFAGDANNPVLTGGSKGILCRVNFNLLSLPTDDPNELKMCFTNRSMPVIFHEVGYDGIDRRRAFLPAFMRAPYGDCNSDQTANVSDAVWIINYVFIGGPIPGLYEP